MTALDANVHSSGETKAIENVKNGSILVHHFDSEQKKKKYVISNAFHHAPFLRADEGVIPIYHFYGKMFNGCDLFNRGYIP